jgi:hypothetical protein
MLANDKSDRQPVSGHVLAMDIVGYSNLLIHYIDPLRGNPRFEKLGDEIIPPDAEKNL